ncbi:hypothetical protein [Luteibacter sp.]|uniref:hypothetical protein n=1 Tax=Luteibacter sp. TaxID=1886636 RepID=UPI003F800FD5
MNSFTADAPPLPSTIQDLLAPYPELLAELRDSLCRAIKEPMSEPRFERAISSLKDTLGDMMEIAGKALDEAENRADAGASATLKVKRDLIGKSRSSTIGMRDLRELEAYCDALDRRAT